MAIPKKGRLYCLCGKELANSDHPDYHIICPRCSREHDSTRDVFAIRY